MTDMLRRILTNFSIASEAVFANKVRSLLTALGIIFGVAAVIAMLAIGSGAQQEILDQIKLVGVNNIVITPVVEQTEGEVSEEQAAAVGDAKGKKNLSLGLSVLDLQSIQKTSASVYPPFDDKSYHSSSQTHLFFCKGMLRM